MAKSKPRDWFVEEALVAAAVVKYGRCFTDGVRMRLDVNDLAELDQDMLGAHDFFMELRHKFVAHSVNAFEESYVNAAACTRDGERLPIKSISMGQHRVVLSTSMAESLRALASRVKSSVMQRIETEEKGLLLLIQSLPLDVIHSGDLRTPKQELIVDKPRKRSNKMRKRRRS